MRKMKFTSWGMACLLGGCLSLVSCQQEELGGVPVAKGTGTITLELNAQPGFASGSKTKAVDEAAYKDKNEYTLRILSGDNIKGEYLFKDRPVSIELEEGAYMLKAFYGNEQVASRNEFYVYGEKAFGVKGGDLDKLVSVECVPACAKVQVDFDATMATYFSDYKVVYDTKALNGATTATWVKDDTEPWYLKVDKTGETVKATISLTPKVEYETKEATIVQTKTLSPNQGWTLKVKPNYNHGQLGLEITIEETTVDEPIDIIIPPNWK